MKKQLFLILTLAILASVQNVFGQATHNSFPIPVTCPNGPLTPIAGKLYNYSVDVTPEGGNFQWWATTDQNFIAAGTNNIDDMLLSPTTTPVGTDLLATSASYGTTSLTDNVDITWSSATLNAALATPTFVVVQYDAPATGCANNLKVYEIDPQLAFTVDIRNLTATYDSVDYGVQIDTCASEIESATYVVATGDVAYNYGDNQLLFEVVLANFSDEAEVSFRIEDLGLGAPGDQTVDLAWGYTPATAGGTAIAADLNENDVAGPITVTTNETNTNIGVSIFVLATVNNNNYEGIVNTPFTLAVNATNAEGEDDVVNTDCAQQTDFEDNATQNILARPEIQSTTPLVPGPGNAPFLPIEP